MLVLTRCQFLGVAILILCLSQAALAEPISQTATDAFRDDGIVIQYDSNDGAVNVCAVNIAQGPRGKEPIENLGGIVSGSERFVGVT